MNGPCRRPFHIHRSLLRSSALVLRHSHHGGVRRRSTGTDEQRRAFQAGVVRKVLDEPVAQALETAKWARIVVAFEHEFGETPSRYPDRRAASASGALGFVPVRRFYRIPVLAGYVNASSLAALIGDPARAADQPRVGGDHSASSHRQCRS